MGKEYLIHLNRLALGQLLDALSNRSEAWQKTADFLTTGHVADGTFICEEHNYANEAEAITSHFSKITAQIEPQVAQQGDYR